MKVLIFAESWCAAGEKEEKYVQVPPPEIKLSMGEAKNLYYSFQTFVSRSFVSHPEGPSLPLPNVYIRCLERILLDFPDERFLYMPRGLGMRERVERGYVRGWLIAFYYAEGKWDEALSLDVQDLFLAWIENIAINFLRH